MAFDDINLGTSPTGAGGDSVRAAFEKTNANFQAMLDQLDQRAAAQLEREKRFSRLVESLHGGLPALRADLRGQSYAMKEGGVLMPVEYPDVLSLTRPGPTTAWDANGNLVTVPSGEPALDHDPVTGEPLGQKAWSAGPVTNVCPDSHDLTTGNWYPGDGVTATLTDDPRFPDWQVSDVVFPLGGTEGEGLARVSLSQVFAANVYSCRRVIFKPQDPTKIVRMGARGNGNFNTNYDPANETVVAADGRNPVNSIRALGGGWYVALLVHDGTEGFSTSRQFMFGYNADQLDAAQTVRIAQVDCFETDTLQSLTYYEGLPSVLTDGIATTRPADDLRTIGDPRTQPYWNTEGVTIIMRAQKLSPNSCMWLYGGNSVRRLIYNAGDDSGGGIAGYSLYDGDTVAAVTGPAGSVRPVTMAISLAPATMTLSVDGVSREQPHNGSLLTDTNALVFGKGVYTPRGLIIERFEIIKRAFSAAELDAITGADA